jgi:hypothetical protein
MADKGMERLESSLGNQVSAKRRDVLKVVAAGAVVYATPVVASFSMDGLKIGRAHALGFGSNQPLGVGPNMTGGGGFLSGIFSRIQGFIRSIFGHGVP